MGLPGRLAVGVALVPLAFRVALVTLLGAVEVSQSSLCGDLVDCGGRQACDLGQCHGDG